MLEIATVRLRLHESTRTKVFGLFMVAEAGSLTFRQLVRLGTSVGLTETNVKSHVSRMVEDGSLVRTGPPGGGRYAPSASRHRVVEALRARLLPRPRSPEVWNGLWWLLSLHRPGPRIERERARRVLRFASLRPWRGDVWVRPAWPRQETRERIAALALRFGCLACEGALAGEIDVRRTFALDALEMNAARLLRDMKRSCEIVKSGRAGGAQAFRLWLELGGRIVRFASEDPRLPPELLAGRPSPSAVIGAWSEFKRRTRQAVRRFVDGVISVDAGSAAQEEEP